MKNSHSESYKAAGVDVTAGYEAVDRIKPLVESTYIPGVIGTLGGFGGLFAPDLTGLKKPVLVSGTDGVGTKLKLAFLMDKHDTVGIDCVAMCVNDIVCSGARPLFFLDYLAVGKNVPERIEAIVSGVVEGCRQAGCALIGGETAEMPGFYPENEYDLAGFSVGLADQENMLDGSAMEEGDLLIGLGSSGLKPTRIYVKAVQCLLHHGIHVRAISHITGGGLYENVPRMMKAGLTARIEVSAFPVPPIFGIIAQEGHIPERDMYNTFNMGVGLVLAIPRQEVGRAKEVLCRAGERAYIIGSVVKGEAGVELV